MKTHVKGEWDKVWEVARSGVTPGVAMPELNEAAARKSSNPANPRTGQHGSANSCLPRFVPLSSAPGRSISGLETNASLGEPSRQPVGLGRIRDSARGRSIGS